MDILLAGRGIDYAEGYTPRKSITAIQFLLTAKPTKSGFLKNLR
jgi:hypothetical protein